MALPQFVTNKPCSIASFSTHGLIVPAAWHIYFSCGFSLRTCVQWRATEKLINVDVSTFRTRSESELMKKGDILKGLTWKSVLVGGAVNFVMAFFFFGQGGGAYYFSRSTIFRIGPWGMEYSRLFHETSDVLTGFGLVALVIFILALINKVRSNTFSIQELAVISIMIPVCVLWNEYDRDFTGNILSSLPAMVYYSEKAIENNLPYLQMYSLWQPLDRSYWESILYTSNLAGVNWIIHIPAIAWHVTFICSSTLLMLFIMLLFRRVVVVVEALPFPTAQMVGQVIEVAQPAKGSKRVSNKWFLIALIASLIYYSLAWHTNKFMTLVLGPGHEVPGFTDGFIGGMYVWPVLDFVPLAIIPYGVPLMLSLTPFEIGWYALMSIDTLISIVIVWIAVYLIVPVYLTEIGYWPRLSPGIPLRIVRGFFIVDSPGGETLLAVITGMLISLAFVPLWRNREVFIPILKSIIGKEPSKEIDPNPPIPYRFVWLGIVICGLAWVWAGTAIGLPLMWMLAYVPIISIMSIGVMFMYAETGGFLGKVSYRQADYWHGFSGTWLTRMILGGGQAPQSFSAEYLSCALATGQADVHFGSGFAIAAFMYSWFTQHSFKLSEITKTEKKSIVKALVIAVFLAAIAGGISFFFFLGLLPFPPNIRPFGGRFWKQEWGPDLLPKLTHSGYMKDQYWTNPFNIVLFILGLILPVLISFGRARFSWFKVTSAGVLFGIIFGFQSLGPMIAGLILKYLVLKIGGTKMYMEKLLPICTGLIVAGGIATVIDRVLVLLIDWAYNIPWVM